MDNHCNQNPSLHFSGIGGTAMVAGARLALDLGWEVRGSDNPLYPPTSVMVEELGIPVTYEYAGKNLDWQPDVVLLGNVLSRGNDEVEAALQRRMKYQSLPEWMKEHVLRKRRPVAVCGTHGKTSTTALTAYLLDRGGLHSGHFIGGQPLDFDRSARLGEEGAPFVIEGDEYDTAFFDKRAKFFHYLPEVAVVTSIEFDHGDIYNNLDEIKRAFRLMLRQIPEDGLLVACADDPGAAELVQHSFSPVTTYGVTNPAADLRAEEKGYRDGRLVFSLYRKNTLWLDEVEVPLAGRHNLLNTLAAIAVADRFGVSAERIREVLPEFRGVRRRMEVFLETPDTVFIDDFAHHPTAMRETIQAARLRWPEKPLTVLFEPRSNTTVTNRFQRELTEALGGADTVWIGPIHRPERFTEAERLNRQAITDTLRAGGRRAFFTDNVQEIFDFCVAGGTVDGVVLILSNGAFGGIYSKLNEHYGVHERNT